MRIRYDLETIGVALSVARGTGKTTALARLAKDSEGVLLVHDARTAQDLRLREGVKAVALWPTENLRGMLGPFFIDHTALERLLHSAAAVIKSQEEEIRDLKDTIRRLRS